jgi:hypothetical protein
MNLTDQIDQMNQTDQNNWGDSMKHVLLGILCVCTSLALTAFAQDTQSQTKHELPQAPVLKPWTGDLDGMVKRRVNRVLVAPSRTSYWVIEARQAGAEYELRCRTRDGSPSCVSMAPTNRILK